MASIAADSAVCRRIVKQGLANIVVLGLCWLAPDPDQHPAARDPRKLGLALALDFIL